MTDLLQQIDAGIARHTPQFDAQYCHRCHEDSPCETLKALQGWREAEVRARAAEAIALGGKLCISEQHADLETRLREAVVEGEKLKPELAEMAELVRDLTADPSWVVLYNHAWERLRAKVRASQEATVTSGELKEARGSDDLNACGGGRATPSTEDYTTALEAEKQHARAEDAEEKMRGLVEALEQVIGEVEYLSAEVEYLSHRAARNIAAIAREALTQAKREGE